MRNVTVVGAGISGLATAFRIEQRAEKAGLDVCVQVVEGAERVGGKIQSVRNDGYLCEAGPNGFLDNKPHTLDLCRDLGIEQSLVASDDTCRRRFVFSEGRLHLLPSNAMGFMLSGLLSLKARARVCLEPLVSRRTPRKGDESLADFGRRRLGEEAFNKLIDPMVSGVFAGDPEQMSLASSFPRIFELEQDYGGLIRAFLTLQIGRIGTRRKAERPGQKKSSPAGPGGVLTSFAGGLEDLVRVLAGRLGDRLHLGEAVERIDGLDEDERACRRYAVATPKERYESDAVVLAVPAWAGSKIVEPLDADMVAALAGIPYAPMVVIAMGYERSRVAHALDGFGFLIPRQEKREILGALWTSSIFTGRAPEGKVLFRVMLGGARNPGVIEQGEDEWLASAREELGSILGVEGEPAFVQVFPWKRAIPQYTVGHGERLERIDRARQRHPGLFFTGNAFRGVAVNDCTRNAGEVAAAVVKYLEVLEGQGTARGCG